MPQGIGLSRHTVRVIGYHRVAELFRERRKGVDDGRQRLMHGKDVVPKHRKTIRRMHVLA